MKTESHRVMYLIIAAAYMLSALGLAESSVYTVVASAYALWAILP